jgi:hypothetical protein
MPRSVYDVSDAIGNTIRNKASYFIKPAPRADFNVKDPGVKNDKNHNAPKAGPKETQTKLEDRKKNG